MAALFNFCVLVVALIIAVLNCVIHSVSSTVIIWTIAIALHIIIPEKYYIILAKTLLSLVVTTLLFGSILFLIQFIYWNIQFIIFIILSIFLHALLFSVNICLEICYFIELITTARNPKKLNLFLISFVSLLYLCLILFLFTQCGKEKGFCLPFHSFAWNCWRFEAATHTLRLFILCCSKIYLSIDL